MFLVGTSAEADDAAYLEIRSRGPETSNKIALLTAGSFRSSTAGSYYVSYLFCSNIHDRLERGTLELWYYGKGLFT